MTMPSPSDGAPPPEAIDYSPRRGPSMARRIGNAALGAASGGTVAWLTMLLAAPPFAAAWLVVPLALLGAGFGFYYGRRVVRATAQAFLEAADP